MEYLDICDESGIPTGEVISRKEAHAKDICHRTAHVWVIRHTSEGTQVLLQKRSMAKESFPGQYDTSSAGHISAGDEPLESARRELAEELSIQAEPNELRFIGTFPIHYAREFHGAMFRDHEVAHVYLYEKEVDISTLTLQAEELDSVAWFDLDETIERCRVHDPRFCCPMGGLMTVKQALNS